MVDSMPLSGESRWDYFLAHAGPDRARAAELHERLARHHRVFLAGDTVQPGAQWDLVIGKALRSSSVIAILVSRHVEHAYYLREEIAVAVDLARRAPRRYQMVPVFLEGRPSPGEVPYGLGILNGLDAQELGVEGTVARLQRLLPADSPRSLLSEPQASSSPGNVEPNAATGPQQRYQRTQIYSALLRLNETQFREVLFRLPDAALSLKAPEPHISPSSVALSMRAIDLIFFVEQAGDAGLDHLVKTMHIVAPHLRF